MNLGALLSRKGENVQHLCGNHCVSSRATNVEEGEGDLIKADKTRD